MQHPLGMRHLAVAIEQFDGAGDDPLGPDGKLLFHLPGEGLEKHEGQIAGRIARKNAIWRAAAPRRRRAVLLYRDKNRGDTAGGGGSDNGRQTPVDTARGQVKQQIQQARAGVVQHPVEQAGGFRANAGQTGDGSKQGIENWRTHGPMKSRPGAKVNGLGGDCCCPQPSPH